MGIFHQNIDPVYLIKRAGTAEDPFVELNETKTVKYGKVRLVEFPDFNSVFKAVSQSGVEFNATTEEIPKETEYRVDYIAGLDAIVR
ncbi:hypothetical protein [Niallia sp. RD1]|uniref:hypothetical protein n=1 Tax=Niallia sp. RD1 TaxID=2962858 RepID=UPI0020C1AD17|nr:hypothetical protein [Niallia sp. RD1]UTI41128.1 hypothetical protein NKG37_20040 [Niallia sp. RD1]